MTDVPNVSASWQLIATIATAAIGAGGVIGGALVAFAKDKFSSKSQRADHADDRAIKRLELLVEGHERMVAQLIAENECLRKRPEEAYAIANDVRAQHEKCMKALGAQDAVIARLNSRVSRLENRLTDLGDLKLDSDP